MSLSEVGIEGGFYWSRSAENEYEFDTVANENIPHLLFQMVFYEKLRISEGHVPRRTHGARLGGDEVPNFRDDDLVQARNLQPHRLREKMIPFDQIPPMYAKKPLVPPGQSALKERLRRHEIRNRLKMLSNMRSRQTPRAFHVEAQEI